MNNLIEIAKQCPDINITVKAGDLLEMVEYCVSTAKKSLEQTIQDEAAETYPSRQKVAEMLNVDLSTLWRWNKDGYLKTVEIGGKRRYRMSDVKKILTSN
ncbi:MAG: helix-turn-helix domain-containing protein [Dysgonamonadaceae bacterium]|jgi:hypothetical protein|nr:helix-turn-helix domain-containing protein [Dysgonamonadaceae bacterium]